MINAFPGSLGLENEKGYMTKESFFHVMEHFINCTKSSKQNPTLLLLDNVETHFSTKTLNLAKENGVVIFTFPPHCTHRLQPLDVGIFGPFKVHYDNAINSYLMNNPASPPTLYRIAGFVKEALCKAVTPHNIIKSFETTGIFPFNRNVFQESDFIMASITEKPDSSKADSISSPEIMTPTNILVDITEEGINTNKFDINVNVSEYPSASSSNEPSFRGPADIRGLPKAKQQENKRRNKRKGRCMIATNTPEKNEIAQRENEKELKKNKAEERRKRQEQKTVETKKNQKGQKKVKKNICFDNDNMKKFQKKENLS
ncbi:uncharacterized protein LOC113003390 [Solenopsis invicta]|uniref:uncharacterized protein LOC113003390 n=1 Tax=Solenopsis invicta TaxID=13686 RepID=UPI00193E834B|nr:uncharacterized protein LOC113003390 [Solenopsis invicta]XP_039309722.1 uncharacterized protein LOC113003390 [Solenopsis invicta]